MPSLGFALDTNRLSDMSIGNVPIATYGFILLTTVILAGVTIHDYYNDSKNNSSGNNNSLAAAASPGISLIPSIPSFKASPESASASPSPAVTSGGKKTRRKNSRKQRQTKKH